MDSIKQHALNNRTLSFQHGKFKKVEYITIMFKRYEASIFYRNYQPVTVVLYEVDEKNAKISYAFSSLTYGLWEGIRKAYILSK